MERIASPFLLFPQSGVGVADKKDANILALFKVFLNFNMTINLICQITAAFILIGPCGLNHYLSWQFDFCFVSFCHFMMLIFDANSLGVRVQHLL